MGSTAASGENATAGNTSTDDGSEGTSDTGENADRAADTATTGETAEAADAEATLEDLRQELEQDLTGYSGTWSIYCKRLDTGEEFCLNDEPMVAASLIKLYVAGAYRDASNRGAVSEDLSENLNAKMDAMIKDSDNEACNTLIDAVGMQEINTFIQTCGFEDTKLQRKMLQSGDENYTSARDCGAVLTGIYEGSYVDPDTSELLLEDLKNQTRTTKIPAGVPSGVETANKTGELDRVENDAAIVWTDAFPYILCIMSEDLTSTADARANIVNISSKVYAYMTSEELAESAQKAKSEGSGQANAQTNAQTNTQEEEEYLGYVAIDPGHQGSHVNMSAQEPIGPGASETKMKATGGTTGRYTGVGEYQLNLDVSLKLRDELEERGYKVIMTREDNDTAISNSERAILANESGADFLIRIHADGANDSSVNGASALIPGTNNPYIPDIENVAKQSEELATDVLDAYCASTGFYNRGITYHNDMTGINWSTIPVMILEMGFMSNESDDTKMQQEDFQDKMVKGIADGIEKYFEAYPSEYVGE